MARPGEVRLPLWSWSYVTFRFGDGVSSALIPLATVLHYDQPVWVLALATAAQNLASVPATFLWASMMEKGVRRRPIVVAGFTMAALAMVVMATLPPFPIFVAATVVYTVFGVATSPAASTMVLQRVPRKAWSNHTAALSRRTGTAYVSGMVTSILLTLDGSTWEFLGEAVAGSPYVGGPHFSGQFAACAVMAASAAVLAYRLVPSWQPPLPHEAGFDAKLVQATQRRFERPVYFPGRIKSPPSIAGILHSLESPHRLWPLGYAMTFMGSVCFFASYTGILTHDLGLRPGLVLLAQLPSNLVTPIIYPWAGRHGLRIGESRGVLQGSILRTIALPVLCLTIVFLQASGYWLILALHGLMGLSFALIQVNGPVLLAEVHPGGRGPGVGTYHASVGTGTLLGSLSAFVILSFAPFEWSYAFAVLIALLGGLLLWRAHLGHRKQEVATPA